MIPRKQEQAIKYISALSTLASLGLSLAVFLSYDQTQGGMQFIESIPWVKDLGVNYALGVMGLASPYCC
jgi:NADH-quinone oxidoreductase subunit M